MTLASTSAAAASQNPRSTRAARVEGGGEVSARAQTRSATSSPRVLGGEVRTSGESGASRIGGDRLPDKVFQLIAKHLAIELARVRPEVAAVPVSLLGAPNGAD